MATVTIHAQDAVGITSACDHAQMLAFAKPLLFGVYFKLFCDLQSMLCKGQGGKSLCCEAHMHVAKQMWPQPLQQPMFMHLSKSI